jgi:LPS O-antigen subunit length determinant protein (WzzB/FepE family)
MKEPKSVEINDEIDLRELFLILWKGKYIILLISAIAIGLTSVHLRDLTRKYSVEVTLRPVIETENGPNLSSFSGLASLAGVSLPTSSSSDFLVYQKLIFSEEVAERLFANQELVLKLFKGEWNSNTKAFEGPKRGRIGQLIQLVKTVLTGDEEKKYLPPSPQRLSNLLKDAFKIAEQKGTGFISISAETSSPDMIIELISNATQETDDLLKERFFVSAEDTLEFYYQKLLTSRSPEHREALAKLISSEDQKLMLASKSSNFVAEPLTMPSVSLYPTSPKSSLVLALGFVLGIFLGAAIVLVRHAIAKPGAT